MKVGRSFVKNMRKLALIKEFRMEKENPHIAAHKRAFPDTRLTAYQMDLIEGTVKDEKAWKRTLDFWAGNAFRGESVWKMLQYYEEQVKKNGYVAPERTWDCGKCFDTGEVAAHVEGTLYQLEMKPCPQCKEAA